LKSVLLYYTEACKALNYDVLIDLLVCDRVKSCISQTALQHVLSLESPNNGQSSQVTPHQSNGTVRRCFICGSGKHLQRFHGDNSGGKHITNSNEGQRTRQVNACVVDKTTVSVVPGNASVGLHSHVTKVRDSQVQTGVMTVSTANSNSLSESITAPVKNESDGVNCTEPTIRARVCDVMVNDDVMLNCEINIDNHKQTTNYV